VYDLVENDQVDLGLVSFPKSTRTIAALNWREEPMVFVSSPQHPLAQQEAIRVENLQGVNMVGFDQGLKIRRAIDRALGAHGVQVNLVMAFDNIETLKRAIEINAGVSLLPEPTVVREVQLGSLVARPLANEDWSVRWASFIAAGRNWARQPAVSCNCCRNSRRISLGGAGHHSQCHIGIAERGRSAAGGGSLGLPFTPFGSRQWLRWRIPRRTSGPRRLLHGSESGSPAARRTPRAMPTVPTEAPKRLSGLAARLSSSIFVSAFFFW
jgi:hypothetical protein